MTLLNFSTFFLIKLLNNEHDFFLKKSLSLMKLCDILTILIWGSWRDLLQNLKKVIKKIKKN